MDQALALCHLSTSSGRQDHLRAPYITAPVTCELVFHWEWVGILSLSVRVGRSRPYGLLARLHSGERSLAIPQEFINVACKELLTCDSNTPSSTTDMATSTHIRHMVRFLWSCQCPLMAGYCSVKPELLFYFTNTVLESALGRETDALRVRLRTRVF